MLILKLVVAGVLLVVGALILEFVASTDDTAPVPQRRRRLHTPERAEAPLPLRRAA
jgi:hypothetical protein